MSQISNRPVSYIVGGQDFEGQLLFDAAVQQPRPGLLMAPNWMGIGDGAIEIAKQVVAQGYVVFIADLYGEGVRPQDATAASAAMMTVIDKAGALRQRMQAALETFKAQPDVALDTSRLAAFGFCFGGHCALELARSGAALRASVSFHGTLSTQDPADEKNIQGAVLVLDGASDPLVPRTQLTDFAAEMTAVNVDWQLTSYGGACHSFTDPQANVPGKMQYDAKIAKRAFAAMYALLDEVFA
ncbi:dienelactone hydrolase family protein [Pseudomonas sp. LS44]|uniref:dienelactone hydrolase family protein n=1 Tax=Pseudomonas sp. LS44 TaxID=1357074 RepID=UPI00215B0BEE|nr:dienelactone hydrolase family protein [Pseudomonas sp. LS44]UVE16279.1 dienelactone hydrolase family protein [Pseudomonas sp. LS44]